MSDKHDVKVGDNSVVTAMNESAIQEEFNAAINFAIDDAGIDGILFLSLWREGNWDSITKEFPEFKGPLPTA